MNETTVTTHPLIAMIPASELRAGHVLAPHPNSPAAKAGQLSANVVVSVTRWANGNGVSFECAPGSSTLSGDYPNDAEIAVYRPADDVDGVETASALPRFREWTRHEDGAYSFGGYYVSRFGEREYVATAPDGSSVPNTGDWTSASRPFPNVITAISACRAHAAQR